MLFKFNKYKISIFAILWIAFLLSMLTGGLKDTTHLLLHLDDVLAGTFEVHHHGDNYEDDHTHAKHIDETDSETNDHSYLLKINQIDKISFKKILPLVLAIYEEETISNFSYKALQSSLFIRLPFSPPKY